MKPTPGSNAALANGCTCPIIDNGYGKGCGWGPGMFWISADCPLHSSRDETLQAEGAPQGAPPGAATAGEQADQGLDSSLEEPDPQGKGGPGGDLA